MFTNNVLLPELQEYVIKIDEIFKKVYLHQFNLKPVAKICTNIYEESAHQYADFTYFSVFDVKYKPKIP
jgi:hypothetical protein